MTLTILLDLDGTLLKNDLNKFLPAYLDCLGEYMAEYSPPDRFIQNLLIATNAMIQNKQPDQTLKQVFEQHFFPAIGLEESDLHDQFEDFYRRIFPTLRSLTNKKLDAIEFVNKAKYRGHNLVIATNPLFPLQAIKERIHWAGLDPSDFQLITSYELCHFAKPNPAFYAEILGVLGWPNEPVIMIGNNPEHDIQAARQLGLATFLIDEDTLNLDDEFQGSGAFSDVFPWIDQHDFKSTIDDIEDVESIQAILLSTPAALNQLLHETPISNWMQRIDSNEWAPVEIICHLRDVDREVNYPRINEVITQNNPFIPGADTDPWAQERNYICQDGMTSLQEFAVVRKRMIEILAPLSQSDWEKPARHAIFGRTDLKEMVKIIAAHDRVHLQQLVKTLRIPVK